MGEVVDVWISSTCMWGEGLLKGHVGRIQSLMSIVHLGIGVGVGVGVRGWGLG